MPSKVTKKRARSEVTETNAVVQEVYGPDVDYPDVKFVSSLQWDNFQKLKRKTIKPTQFISHDCLRTLGIESQTKALFTGVGMGTAYTMKHNTYAQLTLEFLSSYKFNKPRRKGVVITVEFRLMNRDFELNLATFAHMFGLPYDVDIHCPDEFRCTSTWQCMSTFDVSDWNHVPDTQIHHPVLRIWQHFMGGTFLGRTEPHNVRRAEIDILGGYLNVERRTPFAINIPYLFANQLASAVRAKEIVLGGLITHIAVKQVRFNENTTRLKPVEGGMYIDLASLLHLKWLRVSPPNYMWRIDEKDSVLLPSAAPDLPKLEPLPPQPLPLDPKTPPLPRPSYLLTIVENIAVSSLPLLTYSRRSEPSPSSSSVPPRSPFEEEMRAMMREIRSDLTTMMTDTRLTLAPIYSYFARQGIIRPEGPHPSFFTWPTDGYGAPSDDFAGPHAVQEGDGAIVEVPDDGDGRADAYYAACE